MDGVDVDDLGLGDLDISFDTAPSDDGKIRVRIHHPSGSVVSSRQVSRGATPSLSTGSEDESGIFLASSSSRSRAPSPLVTSSSDPFLGVTSGDDADMDFGLGLSFGSFGEGPFSSDGQFYVQGGMPSPLSEGSTYFSDVGGEGGKRRVRIALKSMPQEGGEGGEWEVQLC